MTLCRCLFSLLLLMPLLASAGPAADFAAASRSQQATLLQQWAAAPDSQRLPLLEALHAETVVIDQNKQPSSGVSCVPCWLKGCLFWSMTTVSACSASSSGRR